MSVLALCGKTQHQGPGGGEFRGQDAELFAEVGPVEDEALALQHSTLDVDQAGDFEVRGLVRGCDPDQLAVKRDPGEASGRQQVAVGRALMTDPQVLMLDEPTAGVSPIVMDELFDRILEIKQTGIAILMVEQNARQALNIADTGFVLVTGENRFTDTGEALLANPEVRRAFLGG